MADENNLEQKIKLTYETNADKVGKTVDSLDSSIEKTTESQKENSKQSEKQKQSLENLGGGIGSTIKGFKALLVQMWAIVANPVGLIIAAVALALTGLFKAFTSTNDGADKFDQIMAGIGATIDVLRDRVLKIAGAIAKFFSGDFAGAVADGKAAVSGFGAEVAAEFRAAADAARDLQEVADAMRELGVSRAKLNRDLVEAKEIIDDETASYRDKVDAIEKVKKAEAEQTAAELENAKKKLEAIRTQNALSDSSDEALQAEADAEAALYNLQEQSARDRIKNTKLLKRADNEERARLKEIANARREAAKERAKLDEEERKRIDELSKLKLSEEEKAIRAIQDLNDKTEEEKLARKKERDLEDIRALEQKGIDIRNLLIYNDELYNTLEDELREKRAEEKAAKEEKERQDQLEKDKKFAEEQAAIDRAALEQKRAIEDAKFGLLNKGVALFNNIFGKSKKAQKASLLASNAIGLAEVAINTQRAVMADIAVPLGAGLPKVPIDIAAGALGAANIIASTAKGLKELGGGSAGSAATNGAPNVSASSAPQVGFQSSSENQIATTIANNTNEMPPIETYITESAVTTAQALARNRIEENSFG